jgi:hypothetical protein
MVEALVELSHDGGAKKMVHLDRICLAALVNMWHPEA